MAAMKSDLHSGHFESPASRGFCFSAIRQGYSPDALHQYPCHIVVSYLSPVGWIILMAPGTAPARLDFKLILYSLQGGLQ